MKTLHILLIDDHAMFRSGMCMVLSAGLSNVTIHEASSLNEATNLGDIQVDVVLLDIKLPGLNGVDGIALLKRKWHEVPIFMLSSLDEPETVKLAISRGANGFISKADSTDKIIQLLKKELNIEPVNGILSAEDDALDSNTPQHLTPRQCEVLELICQGLSNKLIARRLDVSENTIRGHVQAILAFLQVTSRSEAAFAARCRHLVR